jgi:pimeloyl-ACP methyl ester carboxylesterase
MKRRRIFVAASVFVGLGILLAGAYFGMNREKRELTPETRAGLPGQFIALPGGMTHYQLVGPAGGQVVVLVHGFSVPSYLWEHNISALTNAGLRVLTFDLYGRGYSDRPQTLYTLDLFVRQVDDLLSALKIDRPVDMVGLSMGGYIAAAFANQHPDRVRRVALLAPQVTAMGSDPLLGFVTVPVLGEYLFTVYIGPVYMAGDQNDFADYRQAGNWRERYLDAMQYSGFRDALLSTLRNMPGDPFVEYRKLGALGRPVLLLWGEEDRTIPIENAPKVSAAIPQAELHVIAGGRHLAGFEFPEKVNPLLVEFFKR